MTTRDHRDDGNAICGVFIGAVLGVLLWGAALGWLFSPWLALIFALVLAIAVFVFLERSKA